METMSVCLSPFLVIKVGGFGGITERVGPCSSVAQALVALSYQLFFCQDESVIDFKSLLLRMISQVVAIRKMPRHDRVVSIR